MLRMSLEPTCQQLFDEGWRNCIAEVEKALIDCGSVYAKPADGLENKRMPALQAAAIVCADRRCTLS